MSDGTNSDDARRSGKPTLVEWLCLAAGLVLVIQYAWFMDDAFVYFRYVDNLLFRGLGLVYNAGEYVEGYSSPLWTLLLIVLRATGIDYWLLTRLVGVASLAGFWWMLTRINRRLAPPRAPIVNLPLCYLTLLYGVLCYFTSGLESPLVLLAAAAYSLFVLNPRSRWLQLALAVTPILRHELAIPFALALGWAWLRNRRVPWGMGTAGVVITGGWVVFRIYYYADLFPNTFYLKDAVDVAQGLVYLQDTAMTYWLYPLLAVHALLAGVLAWRVRRATRRGAAPLETNGASRPDVADRDDRPASTPPTRLYLAERAMMLALALPVALYVIKIGGDPRHFRYLAFPFCLAVCACGGLVEHLALRFPRPPARVFAATVGLLAAVGTGMLYPPQLSAHPLLSDRPFQIVNKINDAYGHRHHKTLRQSAWGRGDRIELRGEYAAYDAANPGRPHNDVAVSSWCVTIFRQFQSRFVQSLGLTEPVLARVNAPAERPAHKHGLVPLAYEIARIVQFTGNRPHRGMYREAVAARVAPRWVADNLETIEVIERKMFNTHDFAENLRLAFTFPKRIDAGDVAARFRAIQQRSRAAVDPAERQGP